MRRTTFLPTTMTAVAVSALLLTGCGSSGGGGTAADGKTTVPPASASPTPSPSPSPSSATPSPSTSVTPPASPTPPVSPSTSTVPGHCADTVTLTAADNGHTVCLTEGGEVRVNLDGSKDRPWSSVRVKGTATLEAVNAGFAVLPGDANAAYRATGTGTAHLTSSRPLCASGPNRMACKGIVEWAVTVTVRGS
ncbi:hypothetical protein [Streptomyces sp. NPDC047000]|uniref:hypothetical protein n=1 Tax=Streptomyces sp. NPDC047000 TaxID=3155474 RepID=UPI0033EB49D4